MRGVAQSTAQFGNSAGNCSLLEALDILWGKATQGDGSAFLSPGLCSFQGSALPASQCPAVLLPLGCSLQLRIDGARSECPFSFHNLTLLLTQRINNAILNGLIKYY